MKRGWGLGLWTGIGASVGSTTSQTGEGLVLGLAAGILIWFLTKKKPEE